MTNKMFNDLYNIVNESDYLSKRSLVNGQDEKQIINNGGIILSPGIRDASFFVFIKNLLMRAGNFKPEIIEAFFQEQHKKMYVDAFTSLAFDPINNYEMYEQIGDSSLGKFLSFYFLKRFSNLNNPEGVATIARLKINYGSKTQLSSIANSLDFWPYISCTEEERNKRKIHLLEDVFEAFIGVTELITENIVGKFQGQRLIYLILEKIFNQIEISLEREDLYDPKTILKEFFDTHKNFGELLYESLSKNEKEIIVTYVYKKIKNNKILIGIGSGTTKKESEQQAAKNAIKYLKKEKLI